MRRTSSSAALVLIVEFLLWAGQIRTASAEIEGVEQLLVAVRTGSEGARLRAAERLFQLDQADRAVSAVAAGLRHDEPSERCLAARVLGLLRSPRGVRALVAAIDDDDWAVRRDVVEALGQIRSSPAVPHVNRRLGDEHPRVRIAVVRALSELGAHSSLPQALRREPDPEVRLHLVEALGAELSPNAQHALVAALQDEMESVRLLAASFLVERGDVQAVAILGARLSGGATATARLEAARALGRSSGAALAPARQLLAQALVDPTPDVSLRAAGSLAALGDRRGEEYLISVIDGETPPEVRARAQELLGETER